MSDKNKPRAEHRKKADKSADEKRALKKAKRREKKHTLRVLKRKATRTGHAQQTPA